MTKAQKLARLRIATETLQTRAEGIAMSPQRETALLASAVADLCGIVHELAKLSEGDG